MLKQFLELLRKESQLNQAFKRSQEMLREDQEMFEAAIRSLRERDDARLEVDIYAKDQLINAYEREVRRKVLTHLTVSGDRDADTTNTIVRLPWNELRRLAGTTAPLDSFDLGIIEAREKLVAGPDSSREWVEMCGKVFVGEPGQVDREAAETLGLRADYLEMIRQAEQRLDAE